MIDPQFSLAEIQHGVSRLFDASRNGSPAPILGRHVLGELGGCERLPVQVDVMREHMERAVTIVGATIVQSVFHEFSPYGLSGVVVIAESHLSVHTWPEHSCACVDLFTCSAELDPRPGFDYLGEAFGARRVDVLDLPRGAGVPSTSNATDR